MPHIAIIGLGLIGGSLGLALRQARVDYQIVGHDRDFEIAGKARKRGAVDKAEWNLPTALRGAGLVILAVPLSALRTVLEQISPHLSDNCVVTDTASTKQQVMAWATECLPATVCFVGGHPAASREIGGLDQASPDLFRERPYCLTPGPSVSAEGISLVSELATMVGAWPFFLDAVEHDGIAAGVNHLPAIAASALLNTIATDSSWRDTAQLGSGAFEEITALADGNPEHYAAICRTNREAILHWLDAYQEQLTTMRRLIAAEGTTDDDLECFFRQSREGRGKWLHTPADEGAAGRVPQSGDRVRQLLIGRLGQRRPT